MIPNCCRLNSIRCSIKKVAAEQCCVGSLTCYSKSRWTDLTCFPVNLTLWPGSEGYSIFPQKLDPRSASGRTASGFSGSHTHSCIVTNAYSKVLELVQLLHHKVVLIMNVPSSSWGKYSSFLQITVRSSCFLVAVSVLRFSFPCFLDYFILKELVKGRYIYFKIFIWYNQIHIRMNIFFL